MTKNYPIGVYPQPDAVYETASSGSVTANTTIAVITTDSLTTASGSRYTLTLSNEYIRKESVLIVNVALGDSTQGELVVHEVSTSEGSADITVKNDHASDALNGTIQITVLVENPQF